MIDTLKTKEELTQAGFSDLQARALSSVFARQEGEIATKDFVRAEIALVRGDIVRLETKFKLVMGVMLVVLGAILGLYLKGP